MPMQQDPVLPSTHSHSRESLRLSTAGERSSRAGPGPVLSRLPSLATATAVSSQVPVGGSKGFKTARELTFDRADLDEQIQQLLRSKEWKQWYTQQINRRLQESQRKQKLIVVANRLPTTVSRSDSGEWTASKSSGGLVSALSGVKGIDMVWVGWPGCEVPPEEQATVAQVVHSEGCVPVFLSDTIIEDYYNGFSNNILWPLFHYITPPIEDVQHGHRATIEWEAYQDANSIFADVVLSLLDEGDLVWVHDYHLMLVPQLLRQKAQAQYPDMTVNIGWFLHTPFPSAEIFRMLPYRDKMLMGVLSANLVAFHMHDYARHFLSSCVRLVPTLGASAMRIDATPVNGTFVHCTTIPIGITPQHFLSVLDSPSVLERVASLKEQWGDRKVILGIDRLDYVKGIPHKLSAFDHFLRDNPEWASQCVLVQLAIPSREQVLEYQRLRRQVHEMVGSICGRHSTLYGSGPPVIYLDKHVDHEELVALYRVADVALITSLRDGMNLVSYEFLACQRDKAGVLIISEFAGAAQSLGAGSIRVNPWNIEETAEAIHEALTMPEDERLARYQYCERYIHTHTAQRWAETFVDSLKDACALSQEENACIPPLVPTPEVLSNLTASQRRVVIVDLVDCLVEGKGGAAGVRNRGTAALPMKIYQNFLRLPRDMAEALNTIASAKNTTLIVTSTLKREVLKRLMGNVKAILAPESGCVYRKADLGSPFIVTDESLEEIDPTNAAENTWVAKVTEMFEYFRERTPGSYTDSTPYALKWHFDNAQADFGAIQSRELLLHLWAGPLSNNVAEVVLGNKCIEVRPQKCNLATNIEKILRAEVFEGGSGDAVDFCLLLGAFSYQDEQVFQAVEETLVPDTDSDSDDLSGSQTPFGDLPTEEDGDFALKCESLPNLQLIVPQEEEGVGLPDDLLHRGFDDDGSAPEIEEWDEPPHYDTLCIPSDVNPAALKDMMANFGHAAAAAAAHHHQHGHPVASSLFNMSKTGSPSVSKSRDIFSSAPAQQGFPHSTHSPPPPVRHYYPITVSHSKMSRARYSLPSTIHVATFLRALAGRLSSAAAAAGIERRF